jgi:hypothetical protein
MLRPRHLTTTLLLACGPQPPALETTDDPSSSSSTTSSPTTSSPDTTTTTGDPAACTRGTWPGSVTIFGPADLAQLAGYTAIDGDLTIRDSALTSLAGLECLRSIADTLEIRDNPDLLDIHALDALAARFVDISNNPALPELLLLGPETSWFTLYGCDLVTSLAGLEPATSLDILYLYGNDNLADLTALQHLTALSSLHIDDNASLTTLTGLDAVEAITSSLYIRNNPALLDVNGLGAVTHIGGSFARVPIVPILVIDANLVLASLAGLSALTGVDQIIEITDNPALLTCDAHALVDQLTAPPVWATIDGNKPDACPDQP